MSFAIIALKDDFTNGVRDPVWGDSLVTGSATLSETGGQAILTLPSSTAGAHLAAYTTSAAYDITSDAFYWNIGTMVATGVAAAAYFQLLQNAGAEQLYWRQLSNAIEARYIVGGVDTLLFTATWNASTYKYLRIRESAGTIFWDSSSNGTSWTNRASVANPFAVTNLTVQFAASCGNVASPGSLRLDDVNLILPAPSSTWRETTADWSIANRLRPVTLGSDGFLLGAIVTADTMDSSRVLGGTLHYYGGPLGSSSGGFLQLTEYASLALAQASPFPIPINGRVDLPSLIDARYMRLYHRSTDASARNLYEFVPRRIVQADDIEAESIRAINIGAGQVTADKIFVLSLAALSANMGTLHMDGVIDIAAAGGIYQGTGTFAAPTTGLKLFNSGGVGKLSGYNAGVEQVTLDTDGTLQAGAGAIVMDAAGITSVAPSSAGNTTAYKFVSASGTLGGLYGWDQGSSTVAIEVRAQPLSSRDSQVNIEARYGTGRFATAVLKASDSAGSGVAITLNRSAAQNTISLGDSGTSTTMFGSMGIGDNPGATTRLRVKGAGATSGTYSLIVVNSAGTASLVIRNDNAIGFFGATEINRPTVSGSRSANAALASLCTQLAALGLITDSTT